MLRLFLKKWIFLAAIIFATLLVALRTSKEFFFFFFWFLVSLTTLSLVWISLGYFAVKIRLERSIAGRLEEDDILEVKTTVYNGSFIPVFNLVLEDHLSCTTPKERHKRVLLEYLGPKSSARLDYRCWCSHRGKYRLGPYVLYIFDPWGLFFLKKTIPVYSEMYVYPQTFFIKRLPPLIRGVAPWFGIETSRASGDEHEFYGIREYKQGDPIKRIHWFSTARKNRFIVKQFQQHVFYRTTIMFNLEKDRNFGRGKDTVTEYTVKIVASLVKHLVERGVSLELIAHAQELVHMPFNKGPEHLEDIMKFLAVAQPESRVSLGEVFDEFSMFVPQDSTLIVVMSDQDWEYLPVMLSLENKNVSLVPLVLITSSFLDASDKQGEIKEIKMNLPKVFSAPPIFFTCGENLEVPFLRS
ncbi:MAG: DUF58 domain-containing protein [Candidatus Omnitrophica bacterium]|nr:DUF58 domain-containing protein [Candidatus Omnitrophota bacterium]